MEYQEHVRYIVNTQTNRMNLDDFMEVNKKWNKNTPKDLFFASSTFETNSAFRTLIALIIHSKSIWFNNKQASKMKLRLPIHARNKYTLKIDILPLNVAHASS